MLPLALNLCTYLQDYRSIIQELVMPEMPSLCEVINAQSAIKI